MKLAIVAVLVAASAFAQDALTPRTATKTVVTMAPVGRVSVVPGRVARVPLSFRVAPGYHINSNKPKSEFLIPTSLKLSAPNGLMVKVSYPAGEDLTFPFSPDEKLNVYTGDFTVLASVSTARETPLGPFRVHGQLTSQACDNKACYPPKTLPVAFDVKVQKSARGRRNPGQSPNIRR